MISAKESIPRLDFDLFDKDKTSLAKDTINAFHDYGFCVFFNHTIDKDLISNCLDIYQEFFNFPDNVKESFIVPDIGGARGFTKFKTETAKNYDRPDLKEFWHVGRDSLTNPKNIWIDELKNHKKLSLDLYNQFDLLGRDIMELIGIGLGLESNFFNEIIEKGNSIMRIINYPKIENFNTDSLRASPHEDINFITLLIGGHQPGLEVLNGDKWLKADFSRDEIVVNVGDMLQRYTNKYLVSATHRVTNGEEMNTQRISIPFFLHPRSDFLIKPLESLLGSHNHYPDPITADDYLNQRLAEIKLK